MINIVLPLPPTANSYQPHTNRGGRCIRYHSAEAKTFIGEVKALVMRKKPSQTLTGPLKVLIGIVPKDNRRQDIDNRIKPLLDALQKAKVFADDSQIKELQVRMNPKDPDKQGYCVVLIDKIANPEEFD